MVHQPATLVPSSEATDVFPLRGPDPSASDSDDDSDSGDDFCVKTASVHPDSSPSVRPDSSPSLTGVPLSDHEEEGRQRSALPISDHEESSSESDSSRPEPTWVGRTRATRTMTTQFQAGGADYAKLDSEPLHYSSSDSDTISAAPKGIKGVLSPSPLEDPKGFVPQLHEPQPMGHDCVVIHIILSDNGPNQLCLAHVFLVSATSVASCTSLDILS